jgi:hypothetical protein
MNEEGLIRGPGTRHTWIRNFLKSFFVRRHLSRRCRRRRTGVKGASEPLSGLCFPSPTPPSERTLCPTVYGDLLDNAEQDGDDDGGLEGLPEHDEEDRNGEHVRHDCFKGVARANDEPGREVLGQGRKGGQRENQAEGLAL